MILSPPVVLSIKLHVNRAGGGGGRGAGVTARRVELVWSSGGAFPPERV